MSVTTSTTSDTYDTVRTAYHAELGELKTGVTRLGRFKAQVNLAISQQPYGTTDSIGTLRETFVNHQSRFAERKTKAHALHDRVTLVLSQTKDSGEIKTLMVFSQTLHTICTRYDQCFADASRDLTKFLPAAPATPSLITRICSILPAWSAAPAAAAAASAPSPITRTAVYETYIQKITTELSIAYSAYYAKCREAYYLMESLKEECYLLTAQYQQIAIVEHLSKSALEEQKAHLLKMETEVKEYEHIARHLHEKFSTNVQFLIEASADTPIIRDQLGMIKTLCEKFSTRLTETFLPALKHFITVCDAAIAKKSV